MQKTARPYRGTGCFRILRINAKLPFAQAGCRRVAAS